MDLELEGGDDRADIDDPLAAVALTKLADKLCGALLERTVDGVVDENSLRSDAVLPAIDIAAGERCMNRLLEVRVVANDESVLAAKLHDHWNDALGAGLDDAPSVVDRADEKNRIDSRARKRGARGAIALHRLDEVGVVSRLLQ